MKKLSVLFIAFAYLSLFNYCVTYAVVTGEAHHPSPSPLSAAHSSDHEAPSHEHGHHDHGDHASSSSHEHDSSDESEDACCANLTDGVHVLLPTGISVAEFVSVATPLDTPVALDVSTLSPSFSSSHEDRGPPGYVAQDGFFSSRSSRAPPYLPSL